MTNWILLPHLLAIGAEQTALVAALREVGSGHVKITPDIVVGGEGGILGGLGAMLMRNLQAPSGNGNGRVPELEPEAEPAPDPEPEPEAAPAE